MHDYLYDNHIPKLQKFGFVFKTYKLILYDCLYLNSMYVQFHILLMLNPFVHIWAHVPNHAMILLLFRWFLMILWLNISMFVVFAQWKTTPTLYISIQSPFVELCNALEHKRDLE
jgi:hypothetical protein